MKYKRSVVSLSLAATLLLTGCANTEGPNFGKQIGTLVGTVGGAIIGKQIGGKKGMLLAGIVGAGIGYYIGNEIDTRKQNLAKLAEKEKIDIATQDIMSSDGKTIGQAYLIHEDSQFNSGKSKLNQKAQKYFTKVAQEFAKTKQKIMIVGHTDDVGSSYYNQKLSEERAYTLAKLFQANGVEGKNIYYYGVGENEPIADNKSSKGRAQNRRVEIIEAPSEDVLAVFAAKQQSNQALFSQQEKQLQPKRKKSSGQGAAPMLASNDIGLSPSDIGTGGASSNGNSGAISGSGTKSSGGSSNSGLPMTPSGTGNIGSASGDLAGTGGGNMNLSGDQLASSGTLTPNNSGGNGTGTNMNGMASSNTPITSTAQKQNPINTAPIVVKYYGDKGATSYSGACSQEGWLTDNTKLNFNGEVTDKSQNSLLKYTGEPDIQENGFSLVTKAHANEDINTFYSSCLNDAFRETGTIKNLESGKEIVVNNLADHFPWLRGSAWYGNLGNEQLVIAPVGVFMDSVKPSTCPTASFSSDGKKVNYGTGTKITTYRGKKAFIYRIFPNDTAQFQCADIAFPYSDQEKPHGVIYYKNNGKYYKQEFTPKLIKKDRV